MIKRFKKWIIRGLLMITGTGIALAAPVVPKDMTYLYSYQTDLSKSFEKRQELKNASTSPPIPEDLQVLDKFNDQDGDGTVSVAVFADSKGKRRYIQIPDSQYKDMGKKGGVKHNPEREQLVSVLEANTADAAIAFDATNEAVSSSATSLTYALTVAADGFLVVSTNSRDNFVGTQSVTYDGDNLTELNSTAQARLWFLATPTTGSSANVVADFDGTGKCGSIAASYTRSVSGSTVEVGDVQNTTGSGTNASIDITASAPEEDTIVAGTMSVGGGDDSITPGDDQTQRGTDISPGSNFTAAFSEEPVASSGTVTHDYTHSSQGWGITAAEIRELTVAAPEINRQSEFWF